MHLTFLILWSLLGATAAAQSKQITWEELQQMAGPDHRLRLVLRDGTEVEARPVALRSEEMEVVVTKTSDKARHPKGNLVAPRDEVKTVGIRSPRTRGRWIGTLAPLAVGVVLLASATTCSDRGYFAGCWYALVGSGVATTAIGMPVGYFVGRAVDRRFVWYTIAPRGA